MSSENIEKTKQDQSRNEGKITAGEAWELFVDFLRRRQCRVTEARHIIVEHIFGRDDHFRADEVAHALGRGKHRVSRGTVYHTLSLLAEAGLVRELRDRDTHVHYESVRDLNPHHHMVCSQCGRFVEFTESRLERLVEAACAREEFLHRSHELVIHGVCQQCAKGNA